MMASVRRTLVDGVVLSLQDSPVFYPCCKGCFSRISVERRDRCRCFQCGYSCAADLVEHRYRLSLKVARDGCIFGLTVFGTCLNPFFGIDASGLQRLVVNLDEPVGTSLRSTLLLKAVQDCFIGRRFIFGIKLNETEPHPWIKGVARNGSAFNDRVHLIASQMILPRATDVEGCTVISYYQRLLQKAAEFQLGSPDPTNLRLPPTSLLVHPHYSPQRSFDKDALWSSGPHSSSALSSQQTDSTFTPTPPWQQSLGLVTSSAEQGEDQDSGDEGDSLVERLNSSHPKKGDCPKDHEDGEETTVSPLSLEHGSYDHLTLDNSEVSHCSLSHGSKAKWLSTKDVTETVTSGSVAWEDSPFAESLTEYLCKNQSCEVTEPKRNAHDKSETPGLRPPDWILSAQSSSASPRDRSRALTDITNTPPVEEADGHNTNSHAKNTCSEEEEHWEVELYNCSADLFSDPVPVDTPNRTARPIAGTEPRRVSGRVNISHVTPNKHKLRPKKKDNRDNLLPPESPQLNFIPPSQSTPIVRAGSPASSRPHSQESSDFEIHTPDKLSSSLGGDNCLARPLRQREATTSVSRSRFALKRRFWKPGVTKSHLQLKVQRAAPEPPTDRVPPTPAAKRQRRGKPRKQSPSPNVDQVWGGQEDGVHEDSGADGEGLPGASPPHLLEESKACDWSRDLFSDSV